MAAEGRVRGAVKGYVVIRRRVAAARARRAACMGLGFMRAEEPADAE